MSSKVIENLYHAFRTVPKPRRITGCTVCCTTEAELMNLSRGVREADTFAINTLAHDGIFTVGTEDDYKYFLPRILHEMILDDDFWSLCVDALTTRIKLAGFDGWTEVQKKATLEALLVIFDKYSSEYCSVDLEDWIYGIASVDFDIMPFLEVLDKPKNETKRDALISDVLIDFRSKEGEAVKFSHGSLTYQQYAPIYQWVAGKF